MIKTREQRKATTLLQRRKTAIIVSLVLVVILTVVCVLLYNYFNTVIPYTDLDGSKYYIKKQNGTFAMYDSDGKILPTTTVPGLSDIYYETESGVCIFVDPDDGSYKIKVVPEIYYGADGENFDSSLLISAFKQIDSIDMASIEVHNQKGTFTLIRSGNTDLSFVLKNSPVSSLNKDLISYLAYIVGSPIMNERIEKKDQGSFDEYGLTDQQRTDYDGNTYNYSPTYYIVTTNSGEQHKLIIGDRLIDGSGYYAQYENAKGERRDAVYIFSPPDMSGINDTSFENTVLAEAKELVVPNIIYPGTSNDYYAVEDFTIRQNNGTSFDTLIAFSYVDLEDRTGTVLGIHPYVFSSENLVGYHPNYDNITTMLTSLLNPSILEISVLSPTNEDKVAYGLMKKTDLPDGSVKYNYDPAYMLDFNRNITVEYTDSKGQAQTLSENVHQTVYISKKTDAGTYYVFTELRFLESADDSIIEGIALDSICEVHESTFNFLTYDNYDWIYPTYMQIALAHTKTIELISDGYNAKFKIKRTKAGDTDIMEIVASDDQGNSIKTFGGLYFKDVNGYQWTVTPTDIKMFTPDGKTEVKPSTRRYEHNAMGEQVYVIDYYANAANGDLIYVESDYVKIKHRDGTMDVYLRYHNTIFKKLFRTINSTAIVDSYQMTTEEHNAIISNPENKLITVKITDDTGETFTYNFYSLTERKAYITVGDTKEVGGFYVQGGRPEKFINDAKKFFAGQDIDNDSHK